MIKSVQVKACLLGLAASLFLTGCWDALDVDRMSFPLAGGYDLHIALREDGREETAPGDMEEPKVDVISLIPHLVPDGETREQLEKVSASNAAYGRAVLEYLDDSGYFPGTLQVLVIGRDLARLGIRARMDSLNRLSIMSSSLFLCLAERRAEEILSAQVEDNRDVAFYLQEMFQNIDRRMYMKSVTLHEFIANLGTGKNPVLPVVGLVEDDVGVVGCGVFEKDRLLRILDMRKARSLMLLRGCGCTGYLPYRMEQNGLPYDEGTLRMRSRRKVRVEKDASGVWHFTLRIYLTGSIMERERIFRVQEYTPGAIAALERQVAEQVQRELTDFITWMQQDLRCDCIDIARFALAKERRGLEGVIDTPEFIRRAKITVETEVKIQNWGEKE